MKKNNSLLLIVILLTINISTLFSQKTADDLAKELANPIASLISVPFQFNFQFNYNGKDNGQNGYKMLCNFQPVIPVSLSKSWNLINRAIVPIVSQRDVTGYNQEQNGIGDILATFFFSPTKGSIIWGIGPAISIPSATNELLGSKKLAIGPSIVILGQPGKWTLGGLFNQLWSVAGSSDRPDISSIYVQPFIAYGFSGGFTIGASSENLYDWKSKKLVSGMFSINASQVFKIAGKQMVQYQFAPIIYYANANVNKPQWGIRSNIVFIFPK